MKLTGDTVITRHDYILEDAKIFNPKFLYMTKQETTTPSNLYEGGDFVTLIHPLSGNCSYIIDGVEHKAGRGDIVVINPGRHHQKIPKYGDTVIEFNMGFYDFCIDGLKKNFLLDENASPVIRLQNNREKFTACCKEIFTEADKDEKGAALVLKALAMNLVALFIQEVHNGELAADIPDLTYPSKDKRSIVQTIVRYMDENYMKDISLESISKNMYLSSVYISKLFKEETGESPINHLIKVRLSKAKDLLENNPVSIKTASELVGYDDAYYFSKLFKKYYGYSPSKIMKRHVKP